jgi:hypothetical protein
MERRGVPSVLIATDAFADLARTVAVTLGLPAARIAVVPHPLGTVGAADVAKMAEAVAARVADLVTAPDPSGPSPER